MTNCFLIKAGDHYVLIDTGYEDDWRFVPHKTERSRCGTVSNQPYYSDPSSRRSLRIAAQHIVGESLDSGRNVAPLQRSHPQGGKRPHARWGFFEPSDCLSDASKTALSLAGSQKGDCQGKIDTFPPYRLRNCDILVAEETGLREIGIPLDGKIIETPGHTVDSISILFEDGDCLIGDAAANFLQFLGSKYCVVLITDMGAYYQSWEKVIAAGARRIFPAHGAPFTVDKLKTNLWKNKAENIVPYT